MNIFNFIILHLFLHHFKILIEHDLFLVIIGRKVYKHKLNKKNDWIFILFILLNICNF